MVELLTLFCDKGVAIQNLAVQDHKAKVGRTLCYCGTLLIGIGQMEEMTEQLASLLLPIEALMTHPDFELPANPPASLTTLFRNVWLLCILFHFTTIDEREQGAMSWQKPALSRIARKTPSIVMEESHDTIVSDLEYNPVIRKEYVETVR